MAWATYRGRVVPWLSWGEWEEAREGFFSEDVAEQARALDLVGRWRVRGFVPHAVESTSQLIEISLLRAYGQRSGKETQLALSASLVRFVNGVVEPSQKAARAISVNMLAEFADVPPWLVDIRHSATHNVLPPLTSLQAAAPRAIGWLEQNYWQRQRDSIANMIGACHSSLEEAARLAAAAARMSRSSAPLALSSDLLLAAAAPHIVLSAARAAGRASAKRRRGAQRKAGADDADAGGAEPGHEDGDPVSEAEAASRAAVAAGRAQDVLSAHGVRDVLLPLLLAPHALHAQYGALVPPAVRRFADVARRARAGGSVPTPRAAAGEACLLRGWWAPVGSRTLPPRRRGFERLVGRWVPALVAWSAGGSGSAGRVDVPAAALCAAVRAVAREQRAAIESRAVDDAAARLLSHRLYFLAWWVRYLLSAHWHGLLAIAERTRNAVGRGAAVQARKRNRDGPAADAVPVPTAATMDDAAADAPSLAAYVAAALPVAAPLRVGRRSPWAAAVLRMLDACAEGGDAAAFAALAPVFASAETLAHPPAGAFGSGGPDDAAAGAGAGTAAAASAGAGADSAPSAWRAVSAAPDGWNDAPALLGANPPLPYAGGWPRHVHLMPWSWDGQRACGADEAGPEEAATGLLAEDAGAGAEGTRGEEEEEESEGARATEDQGAAPSVPSAVPGGGDGASAPRAPAFGWSWTGGAPPSLL